MNAKQDAVTIFNAAVAAVQPAQLLASNIKVHGDRLFICGRELDRKSFRNIYITGAGKAAAAMAAETARLLGPMLAEGLVVTKYGHSVPAGKIKILEAAHPVPDQNGVLAVKETLALLSKVTEKDIVICLISGGASALWCDLPPDISLQNVQFMADELVKSGAAINEINIVRKHVSLIKGGQLVLHCKGAQVFSLIISDVPDDDLSVIGSGPTTGDPSSFQDAKEVLQRYHLYDKLDNKIRAHLEKGISGQIDETPVPTDPHFKNTFNIIVGSNRIALSAATKAAISLGYQTIVKKEMVSGDTREEAKKMVHAALAYSGEMPGCLLQGGETTLKVTGGGKGGRNQHFVLCALSELYMLPDRAAAGMITLLSAGTDGTDGPTDAAGAITDADTLKAAMSTNSSIEAYLKNYDSYHFFNTVNGLIITGPTQTNVMDIMITLINHR